MKPGSLRHGVKAVLLAAALPLAASACAGRLPSAAALEGPPPPAPSTFHVLMLSGGGSPAINYQTHLLHLDELRRIVEREFADAGEGSRDAPVSGGGDEPVGTGGPH